MKVTVVYNGRRQIFEKVETLTFENFSQAVATAFDLENGKFNILLGENVVGIEGNLFLSDFGIISGDLLTISNYNSTQAAPSSKEKTCSSQLPPRTVLSASLVQPEDLKTCVSQLTDFEELDHYILACLEKFMKEAKFNLVKRIALPNNEVPSMLTLRFKHESLPTTSSELALNYFRDLPNSSRVTSVTLFSMIIIEQKGERCFFESIQLIRSSNDIDTQLHDVVLKPLKERLLGPDNALLRAISTVDIMLEIFQHLSPKEILKVETTCKYANWKCRSSRALDEHVWKKQFKEKFGHNAVPVNLQHPETYRALYQQKIAKQRRNTPTESFQPPDNEFFFPFRPYPSYYPERFQPRSPFAPSVPPSLNPSNPLDPFTGGLILPNHRPHFPGLPRIYPHQPQWPDPLAQPPDILPDPDMPQGLFKRSPDRRIGPFPPNFPRRSGGGNQSGGWPPFSFI